jgi:hypothetical protein
MDRQGIRSLFAGRVTQAWETLKTPERRAAYDLERSLRKAGRSRRRRSARSKHGVHAAGPHLNGWRHGPKGLLRRAMWLLLGGH